MLKHPYTYIKDIKLTEQKKIMSLNLSSTKTNIFKTNICP